MNLSQQIIARAWNDEAFKKALLENPRATIEREFGVKLMEGIRIQIHEQTEEIRHLVLPPRPDESLSDEDLEQAAGGFSRSSNDLGGQLPQDCFFDVTCELPEGRRDP